MIKLRGIEKSYRTGAGETFVLRRISSEVGSGEFVTIMGPSGAGKSTLLSILGMLDGDWRGEYYLDHHAVHALKPRARIELNKQYIGFVFQQYHLLDDLTVYENLEIPLSYRNVKRKDRQAIVADTLDRFQIVGKKDLYPNQLSGGQQQLVAVARAIIAEPKIILADEPTGSLHSSQGKMIMGDAQRELGGLRKPRDPAARRLDRGGIAVRTDRSSSAGIGAARGGGPLS
jgi:ABC-type lipoprotein export system ATPase subunit